MRQRDGAPEEVIQREGDLYWIDTLLDGGRVERNQALKLEPATTARPGEWRITRVHTYPGLAGKLPPHPATGRLILLLVQTKSGRIWPFFVDEESLRWGKGWLETFRRHMVNSLDRPLRRNRAILGYFETDTGRQYTNA